MQARATPPRLASAQFTNTGAQVTGLDSGQMSINKLRNILIPSLVMGRWIDTSVRARRANTANNGCHHFDVKTKGLPCCNVHAVGG